jgi:hypothetical protein
VSAPVSRARISPTVRSRVAGSGSGRCAYVPQARSWVMSDAQHDSRMVGQKGPARHPVKLSDSGKKLLVSCCGYSLKPSTGRKPPTAASFPELSEGLMLIGRRQLTPALLGVG